MSVKKKERKKISVSATTLHSVVVSGGEVISVVTRIVAGLSRTSEGLDAEMIAWECKHLKGHGSADNFMPRSCYL